ncbi:DUF2291 family protein [uncultured Microbacterium sp.]|uniref:DUF2291 family protein n=1 Tax=uncultured Microbacterium sp. TaxID=191216 RepID=UPI002638ABFD|nr:DUF2291 domain-containing protein [uncultured Microbacterium sp.]
MSPGTKRVVWIIVAVVVLAFLVLGTRVVSNDNPAAQKAGSFNPDTYGAENFPKVQKAVEKNAADAKTLAEAIAADPAKAASEFAVQSSGGPVYSVTFTGVVGEGASGIYAVNVDGVSSDNLAIRVQTGPAINGTDLRDATGDIKFGQFTNQIDYQNAAAAINEELKKKVLSDIDAASLQGKTIEVTGAFTLINPKSWLVTPVAVSVK